MKKVYVILVAVIAALLVFTGCKTSDPNVVAIKSDKDSVTLAAYMTEMQDNGELTFKIEGGMVAEINGTANSVNTYWMLYTDDAENSNSSRGTYEYENKTLALSALGAESLTVKNGYLYVWVYQQF